MVKIVWIVFRYSNDFEFICLTNSEKEICINIYYLQESIFDICLSCSSNMSLNSFKYLKFNI